MKIERKLNKNKKSTDLFKGETVKVYEVNTDHKTFLLVQNLLKDSGTTAEEQEKANDKALGLLVGEENWKEIKEAIEKMPNYMENITTAQIEIYSIAYNLSFEEMAERFQKSI